MLKSDIRKQLIHPPPKIARLGTKREHKRLKSSLSIEFLHLVTLIDRFF